MALLCIYLLLFCTNLKSILCADGDLVHDADRTLADALFTKVRILCAVVQTDLNPQRRKAIEKTWGPRCNELAYLSTNYNKTECSQLSGNIEYCGPDKHRNLNVRRVELDKKHFTYIYNLHSLNYDWYLLINSKGYIIPENMRYMLADHNPDSDIYFMSKVKEPEGLNLILSRRALDTFVLSNIEKSCAKDTPGYLDREQCLSAIGLTAADSRDSWGRDRILPGNPYERVYPSSHLEFWYCDRAIRYKDSSRVANDYDCFSDFPVSFDSQSIHYVYVIDFLVYQLRPYGVNYIFDIPKILGEKKPQTIKIVETKYSQGKPKKKHRKKKKKHSKKKGKHNKQKENQPKKIGNPSEKKDNPPAIKDNHPTPKTKIHTMKDNIAKQEDNILTQEDNNSTPKDNIPSQENNMSIQEDGIPLQEDGIPIQENIYKQKTSPIQEDSFYVQKTTPIQEDSFYVQKDTTPIPKDDDDVGDDNDNNSDDEINEQITETPKSVESGSDEDNSESDSDESGTLSIN